MPISNAAELLELVITWSACREGRAFLKELPPETPVAELLLNLPENRAEEWLGWLFAWVTDSVEPMEAEKLFFARREINTERLRQRARLYNDYQARLNSVHTEWTGKRDKLPTSESVRDQITAIYQPQADALHDEFKLADARLDAETTAKMAALLTSAFAQYQEKEKA